MSNQWYVTGCVLTRYLLALPASLLVAAGLFRQSQSREIKEIGSFAILLHIRGLAIVFTAYAILAGVIVPKAPFHRPHSSITLHSKVCSGFPSRLFAPPAHSWPHGLSAES